MCYILIRATVEFHIGCDKCRPRPINLERYIVHQVVLGQLNHPVDHLLLHKCKQLVEIVERAHTRTTMDSPAHVGASLQAAGYQTLGELPAPVDDPTKYQPRDGYNMGSTSSEEEEEDEYGPPHPLKLSISMSGSEEDEEDDDRPAAQDEAEVSVLHRDL